MASKYLQTFPIPESFHSILEDFSREILREQPTNLVEFGALYFKAKEAGTVFEWDPTKSNMPKPADYARVQGAVDPKPQSSERVMAATISEKSMGSKQSSGSMSSTGERARQYVEQVVDRIFEGMYADRV